MSDANQHNRDAMLWTAKPKAARQPRPGEHLFTFQREADHFVCELRDHGAFGVEAQFLLNGTLFYARTFRDVPELGMTGRALAIAWAEQERPVIQRQVDLDEP